MNKYTKASQWDKPEHAVYPPDATPPSGPPPPRSGYGGSGRSSPFSDRKNVYGDVPDTESDAALAARLQAEENARVSRSRDAQSEYQSTPMPNSYDQPLPPREQKSKGGILGKLFGSKTSGQPQYGGGSSYGQQGGYQQGGGGYGGEYRPQPAPYPPQGYQQQQSYGGYPPQGGGYGGGYGGGGGGYGGGYGQQAAPAKSGGMGALGGAALGLGGGLVGGMLLEDAIQDHDQNEYDQGYRKFNLFLHILIISANKAKFRTGTG